MSKIYTYFGFKNGNLVSVVHSVNADDVPTSLQNLSKLKNKLRNGKKTSQNKKRAFTCFLLPKF